MSISTPTGPQLKVDLSNSPDLTGMLKMVRIAGTGSLSVVYRCSYAQNVQVAVKAITFPIGFNPTEKNELMRKVRHGFGIWRRLEHPNIVPLLGMAYDKDFGSDLPCIVSIWMTNGTLNEYVKQRGTELSLSDRVQLIKGSVSGLEYLHSHGIVHGNLHPGNILVDDGQNARLADLGFSLSLFPMQEQLSYLWTDSIRPGKPMWIAPELLYPELYPKLKSETTLESDIYSLGSTLLFILSGKFPWRDRGEAENKLKEFQNPPRPMWPINIPDGVWDFVERCWSPRNPRNRPSAQEVSSFSTDRLEQLLRPNPASDINVVLFGALGSGKSSIINLLAEKEIAQVSSGVEPCTERPRWYQISADGMQYRLWDTMGFFLAHEGPISHLLPYEHAYSVLRNLPEGVNLILLCAQKGIITPSLGRLYWLINHFFYGGRAPIAFIVTHFDTPDEDWWERNKRDIAQRTSIPIQLIPHACVTTLQPGHVQSKCVLSALLETYAASRPPIPLRLDFTSYTTASSDLTTHCRLSKAEAISLIENFKRPLRPFNVVLFGETDSEMGSIIRLITGHLVAETGPGAIADTRPYEINTGTNQFRIWNTMGVNQVHVDHDVHIGTLEKSCQLIRGVSSEGGVDLLVFCKRFGTLTPEELNCYRLFEESLCKSQSPVAIIVTRFDSLDLMEKWWEKDGKALVKAMGGDVVGHTCIPPLADGIDVDKARVASRVSIETMLEGCVSSRSAKLPRPRVKAILTNFPHKAIVGRCAACQRKMTVKSLMACHGLTKEQAERFMQSYND